MYPETAIAVFIAPTLRWLSRKAMSPIVRRVRAMPDSKLKRALLYGEPTLMADRPSKVRSK